MRETGEGMERKGRRYTLPPLARIPADALAFAKAEFIWSDWFIFFILSRPLDTHYTGLEADTAT